MSARYVCAEVSLKLGMPMRNFRIQGSDLDPFVVCSEKRTYHGEDRAEHGHN